MVPELGKDALQDFNQLLSVQNQMDGVKKNEEALNAKGTAQSGSEILLNMERERRKLIGIKLVKRKEEEHYLELPKTKYRRDL